jgi:DNA polymerase III alpha subunit
MGSHVDPYGRVTIDFEDLAEALYAGLPLSRVSVVPSPATAAFNANCEDKDRPEFLLRSHEPLEHSPEEEHAARASRWLICEDLRDLDVRAFVRSLCTTPEQVARVDEEMDLFEARGHVPLLQTMICLVDHFRRNKVVWGVGRGSSVASYVLFLIGVHRIDSMRYGLGIREFLKD